MNRRASQASRAQQPLRAVTVDHRRVNHYFPPCAILLDRDGVINQKRADYVKSWQEFQLLPGVLAALRRLATLPIPIVVITNQSAIGRGLVALATVAAMHDQLAQVVHTAGGRLDGFFVCPHHPTAGCACRKPQPGLLLQAARHFGFDLGQEAARSLLAMPSPILKQPVPPVVTQS